MIRGLEYTTQLSLEESIKRLDEVEKTYQTVQTHYSGLKRLFGKKITSPDLETLGDCIGILLPLTLQQTVQDESKNSPNYGNTVLVKTHNLQNKILQYLDGYPVRI